MFCSKCGNAFSQDAIFCNGCGNKRKEINTAQQVSSAVISATANDITTVDNESEIQGMMCF